MNLLGIDFGTRRVGLAWVDTDIGAVLPFGLISGSNLAELREKLLKIIDQEKPDKIIFGLPLTLENQESTNAERVRKFAKEIQETAGVAIDFFDERFSSQMADRFVGESSRDEMSAVMILQDYIKKK